MEFDELSNRVIGCAIEVHRHLGPELLESAYEQCLTHELSRQGVAFQLQHPLPVQYKDVQIDCGYRIDILIENELIVELKSVEGIKGIHEAQLLTYMKLSGGEGRTADEFQRDKTERWHQTFRSLIPSCSSCPSWWNIDPCPLAGRGDIERRGEQQREPEWRFTSNLKSTSTVATRLR